MTTQKKKTKDTTDRNPTWCTVSLRRKDDAMENEQCEHTDAMGRYVVMIKGEWHGFEPNTKMQANAWVNGRKERNAQIRWLCYECGRVMPLADQLKKTTLPSVKHELLTAKSVADYAHDLLVAEVAGRRCLDVTKGANYTDGSVGAKEIQALYAQTLRTIAQLEALKRMLESQSAVGCDASEDGGP